VTSLAGAPAPSLRESSTAARAGGELHQAAQAQLASDRTSCRDPRANQVRLILHGCAYWLLYMLRAAAPKRFAAPPRRVHHAARAADQDRGGVVEGAARIRVWLPTACPDRKTFALLAGRLAAAGP